MLIPNFVVTKALLDCGLTYNHIEQACVGYVYGKKNAILLMLYEKKLCFVISSLEKHISLALW